MATKKQTTAPSSADDALTPSRAHWERQVMARASKKTTKRAKPPARQRGSSPRAKGPDRADKNGRQAELTAKGKPLAPSDSVLEECDVQLVAARAQLKAEQENVRAILARVVMRLKKKRWPKYRTRSGFVFEASLKDVVRRKRAPAGDERKPRKKKAPPSSGITHATNPGAA